MANKYKIYTELNLLVVKISPEEKSFDELYNLAKEIRQSKDFSIIHYTFIDFRGAKVSFDRDKINDFKNLIDEYKNIDNQQSVVYIMDEPMITVFVHLLINKVNSTRKYCSTVHKAYDLLGLDVSLEKFVELINI